MFKVLFLIAAERVNNIADWVNIGYISSSIKRLPNVETKMKLFQKENTDEALKEFLDYQPQLVGIPLYQYGFNESVQLIDKLKEIEPDVFIVAGNVEASLYADYIFSNSKVDGIIVGEGEETFYDVCSRIISSSGFDGCEGFYLRDGSGIRKNPMRRRIEDLDELPFPDRPDEFKKQTRHSIIGSRGCSGRCTFCAVDSIFRAQKDDFVRVRSVSNIVDEIELLLQDYNCKFIMFLDSTFCMENDDAYNRLLEFYNEMHRRNIWIQFFFNLRCEQIDDKIAALLKSMIDIGLSNIAIGIDAANENDLNTFCKRSSIAQNEKAIASLIRYEIPFIYGFINFNPYTTIANLWSNYNFFVRNHIHVDMDIVARKLMLYSGTAITKQIYEDGLLCQDYDKPILDPYGYEYVNSEIDKLQRIACYCKDKFIKDAYEFRNQSYQRFQHVYSEEAPQYQRLIGYKELSDEFRNEITKATLEIFRTILEHSDYDFDDLKDLMDSEVAGLNNKLKDLQKEINEKTQLLYIYLQRKGEIIS